MRAAVLAAAFSLGSLTLAAAQSPRGTLPPGTALVVVSDGHFAPGAKPGAAIAGKLADPLRLDGETIAAAGTPVRITLAGRDPQHRLLVSLGELATAFGKLPIRSSVPLDALDGGTRIDAVTAARIEHEGDRFAISVPFPFRISSDVPASAYTPTPARTAKPFGKPAPSPSPAASPSPSPSATKSASR